MKDHEIEREIKRLWVLANEKTLGEFITATRALLAAQPIDAGQEPTEGYAQSLQDVWEGKPIRSRRNHRWDNEGERCVVCGETKYIGTECNPQPIDAEPVAWLEHGNDGEVIGVSLIKADWLTTTPLFALDKDSK